jgi:hypothetical protein
MQFFTKIEKVNHEIYLEALNTLNSKRNPEQKEQHWEYYKYQTSNYTTEP